MKRIIAFLLFVSLALGADLAFGGGELTARVFETLDGMLDWVRDGGDKIAGTAMGFRED